MEKELELLKEQISEIYEMFFEIKILITDIKEILEERNDEEFYR